MSATDHLNQTQFRPIEEIGKLRSQYYSGTGTEPMTVEQAYQAGEHLHDVADPATGMEVTGEEYMGKLRSHMAASGLQNPVNYGPNDLMDGHHRYAAARDLGWTQIPAKPWSRGDSYRRDPEVPGWDA